ncbi:hypothetical protein EVAR_86340_1 [Eumeta japonica]|uniref:Uncharacterized protein n=1 Tax=Eumeta variegata TaxID=151549 RepID=A0A4C1X371_EUMVA|nr:hypothetical protein EVAR_86340_1 [Eumeta japonica]
MKIWLANGASKRGNATPLEVENIIVGDSQDDSADNEEDSDVCSDEVDSSDDKIVGPKTYYNYIFEPGAAKDIDKLDIAAGSFRGGMQGQSFFRSLTLYSIAVRLSCAILVVSQYACADRPRHSTINILRRAAAPRPRPAPPRAAPSSSTDQYNARIDRSASASSRSADVAPVVCPRQVFRFLANPNIYARRVYEYEPCFGPPASRMSWHGLSGRSSIIPLSGSESYIVVPKAISATSGDIGKNETGGARRVSSHRQTYRLVQGRVGPHSGDNKRYLRMRRTALNRYTRSELVNRTNGPLLQHENSMNICGISPEKDAIL